MELPAFKAAWLDALEKDGTLAAGASDELLRRYRSSLKGGRPSPPGLVRYVVGILAGEGPEKYTYLNPAKAVEVPGHPFAAEAMFLRPLLTEAGANGLPGRFAVEMGHSAYDHEGKRQPGRIAERVVEALLYNRADNRFLRPELRPPIPPGEAMIAGILAALKSRGVLRQDIDPAALAAEHDWATLGNKPRREAVRTTLTRLATGHRDLLAPGATTAKIGPDDPIFGPREASTREPEEIAPDLQIRVGYAGY